MSKTFVHQFFISLSNRISRTVRNEISPEIERKGKDTRLEGLSYYVDAHLELTANQASIVFILNHDSSKWLFTGDADEIVFERLISSGENISATYLKVPHHGSRGNLSGRTLKAIAPDVAIISHGNKKFGRSKDSHPHHEIIDLLDILRVRSYYTNDVIKAGKRIKPKSVGIQENGLIVFS